jgi:hypothetical protein
VPLLPVAKLIVDSALVAVIAITGIADSDSVGSREEGADGGAESLPSSVDEVVRLRFAERSSVLSILTSTSTEVSVRLEAEAADSSVTMYGPPSSLVPSPLDLAAPELSRVEYGRFSPTAPAPVSVVTAIAVSTPALLSACMAVSMIELMKACVLAAASRT